MQISKFIQQTDEFWIHSAFLYERCFSLPLFILLFVCVFMCVCVKKSVRKSIWVEKGKSKVFSKIDIKQKWSTHQSVDITLKFCHYIFVVVFHLLGLCLYLLIFVFISFVNSCHKRRLKIKILLFFFYYYAFHKYTHSYSVFKANWPELEFDDGQINVDGRHLKIIITIINEVCVRVCFIKMLHRIDDIKKISHTRAACDRPIYFLRINVILYLFICVCAYFY